MNGLGKNTKLPGAGHRRCPVRGVQFAINAGGVSLDGPPSYDEMLGDLWIGFAYRHEMKYFQLALT